MSEHDEDLELQALARQLDDAFETTRPRRAFEDELWLAMQARRPLWRRLRDAASGLVEAIREAPAVPAATVAVVLVLAIGVGIITLNGAGRGTSTATLSNGPAGGGQYAALGPGAFGRLPSPGLHPEQANLGTVTAPKASAGPNQDVTAGSLYFGPATLVWAGQLSVQVGAAPVYRYVEPAAGDADQFATAYGASPQGGQPAPGVLGSYAGNNGLLVVTGTSTLPLREPFYFLTYSGPRSAATDEANTFLTAHSLVPSWPNVVVVDRSGGRVRYLRQFDVPGIGTVYMVDGLGERYGLEVDLPQKGSLQVAGPLPVVMASADYRIISGDAAVRSALASGPSGLPTIQPVPTVSLTSAELVYVLVPAGDHSFYEPAYLFSGTFTYNGTRYVKRVLVPAVDPAQRSA